MQVGEIPRAITLKEDASAACPSPDLDLSGSPGGTTISGRRGTVIHDCTGDAESALLVSTINGAARKENDTICWKLRTVVHRLCSTHQFKNLQVNINLVQILTDL